MSDEARKLLTDEEQKWASASMDNTKAWLVPSLRSAADRLAEARVAQPEPAAREAVYVGALRRFDGLVDAAVYGQFDELRASWVQDAIRKALVHTSPAAVALLAQGKDAVRILERVAAGIYGDWCGHCQGKCLPCDIYFTLHRFRGEPFDDDPRARAALAPGEEKE